jgi:hypothetical protein
MHYKELVSDFCGFEISVDEAAYLVDRVDLGAPLPDVLALYSALSAHPDFGDSWNTVQHDRLTGRGILTPTGVLPDVAALLRDLAAADETLAIRITPLRIPDTMLRIAIGRRDNHFVYAARTHDLVLAQPVAAVDWPGAAAAVLDTQLGAAPPAPLSAPLQLPAEEVKRIANRAPGTITDTLIDHGAAENDAILLNAASQPIVATEITANLRVGGTTRRGKTALSILDTDHGRIIAWPHTGLDQRTWISYAEGAPHRLHTAVQMLFEQLREQN